MELQRLESHRRSWTGNPNHNRQSREHHISYRHDYECRIGRSGRHGSRYSRGSKSSEQRILELRVSTLGFTNVTISWAWQRSDTGFNNIVIQESIDGTTFEGFTFVRPQTNFFGGNHLSFGPGSPMDNNPFFAIRITLSGATSEAGTLRFDNIVVQGNQIIPEPTTILLLGTGLAGVAAKVRRRRRDRGR